MSSKSQVLIIDDDRDIARGMSARLKAAGFDVATANDGASGLDAVEADAPDAIILDIRMPGLDGLTVLDRLKSSERTSGIPTIMVSASLVDQRTSLDRGAAAFMQKPYDANKLILALRAALGNGGISGETENEGQTRSHS